MKNMLKTAIKVLNGNFHSVSITLSKVNYTGAQMCHWYTDSPRVKKMSKKQIILSYSVGFLGFCYEWGIEILKGA